MTKPTHIRVEGTSRSLCGNATVRSTFVDASIATCQPCSRKAEADRMMRFISANAPAINSATGPLLTPDLGVQIAAFKRGVKQERARAVAELRRLAAAADEVTDPQAAMLYEDFARWLEADHG